MPQQPLPANLKMFSASAPMLWMAALANLIFVTAARDAIQKCSMTLLNLCIVPFILINSSPFYDKCQNNIDKRILDSHSLI